MTISGRKAQSIIEKALEKETFKEFVSQVSPIDVDEKPLPPSLPYLRSLSKEAQFKRIEIVEKETIVKLEYICNKKNLENNDILKGNIENYIGMTQVPTGLIGPLRINGLEAKGDFYVPLATSEGALVASYNRGAQAVSLSGGISCVCLSEAVQRTPSFKFVNFREVAEFAMWALNNIDVFKDIVSQKTSHGKLEDIKPNIDGNLITLVLEFTTGDAAGQNMVTICTDAICKFIIENSPVAPQEWLIEGNLSGDKKASAISLTSVRGKKVTAEVVIKKELIKKIFNSTPENMFNAWKTAIVNGIQSGSIGVNFHFSNCLTAIFLACGQDVATISEASIGTTRFDINKNNDLYACVTLPNLIVGTVGGGTGLPTMKECLQILDCYGTGKARKFAEICAATALCGELSICASIAEGEFARAHALFGRKK